MASYLCLVSLLLFLPKLDSIRISEILQGYDRRELPTLPVQLQFTIQPLSVSRFDAKQAILTLRAWLTLKWKDPGLKFGTEEEVVRIPSEELWRPDISLINAIRPTEVVLGTHSNAVVSGDGSVLWVPSAQYTVSCSTEAKRYPKLRYACRFKFLSWSHTGQIINLSLIEQDYHLSEYSASPNLILTNSSLKFHEVEYDHITSSLNGSEVYQDVTLFMAFETPLGYPILTLILPIVLLSFLSLIIFLMNPGSLAKLGLGLAFSFLFLALLVFVRSELPPGLSEMPIFLVFLLLLMCMNVVATVISLLTISLYHNGGDKPVPGWMRKVFIDTLGRVCHLETPVYVSLNSKRHLAAREQQIVQELSASEENRGDLSDNLIKSAQLGAVQAQLASYEKHEAKEWQIIATAIDRTVFILYLILLLCAVACLVVVYTVI